jgi:hypothetical protein
MKKKDMNSSLKNIRQTFILLTVFAIAMGFLEGIVVVYLRQVYYPRGFDFPLTLLTPEMLSVEWSREIATMIMLGSIAWLAGRNLLQRLSFFLFTFAIWDIFYYVALKLIIDWPSSWLTWDILFLIPVPWIGPVLAPVIFSLTMIMMSVLFTYLPVKGKSITFRLPDLILIFAGGGMVFFTFIRDYLELILRSGILSDSDSVESKEHFWKIITSFIPAGYNWFLFIIGELFIMAAIFYVVKHSDSTRKHIRDFTKV